MTIALDADFKTGPYLHQLREFEFHAEDPARALLWQMRTGKSKVVIDKACHLRKRGLLDTVILFSPNGVHDNWTRRELPLHHWDTVQRDTLTWQTDVAGEKAVERVPAHERRGWQARHDAWWARAERVLATDRLAWFSFASETMIRPDARRLIARIMRRRKAVMVAFDESQDFRTPGSKRTKMASALARRCDYRLIMTGTPVENSPLNSYSQYGLLQPGGLGFDTFEDFKRHHAVYETRKTRSGRRYPALVEYRDLEGLRERMAPLSSVVLRSDCEDLPDLIPIVRRFDMTEEQSRVYGELLRQFEVEIDGDLVSIGENTQRLVKLQQVASGFVKDEFGDLHRLQGGNPRMEALVQEAEACAGKVIVWCAFHEDMDEAARVLRERGHRVVEYHGRISADDKRAARQLFEPGADNDVKALVGWPTPGLDLSEAERVIWCSHVFDAVTRSQGEERATAMGGQNVPVVDLMGAPVDGYIRNNVTNKVSVATALSRDGMKEVLRRLRL